MITINANRLLGDLYQLSEIGRTPQGGAGRTAFSVYDMGGRMWFQEQAYRAGFEYVQDGAGNQFAFLRRGDTPAPVLLCGSHLDSVENGGHFDGTLGVAAGLEALRTIQENNLVLPVDIGVVNFTDEEGTVLGLMGSMAVSGQLTAATLAAPRGGTDALADGMRRLGISHDSALQAAWQPDQLLGFVELHIEQGRRLEASETHIGVVTSIVGNRSLWLRFVGSPDHAGTRPLADRQDALQGAAAFILRAPVQIRRDFHPGVMNCGTISVSPGAFNIVPGTAALALELRHGDEQSLDAMEQAMRALASEIAAEYGLTLTVDERSRLLAAKSAESMMQAIEQACHTLGLSHQRMMSFAGHDAQSMATITPTAMIFAPSVDGLSHHHHELTHDKDVINSANCLLHTLLQFASHASVRR